MRKKTKPEIVAISDPNVVEIRGARQNNLKGIDLDLPLGKLNVISGPSGCGKSSLAFDTIYAEGQRRYVETFSPYTRQFLERMERPQVDEIRGIPPAIAIEQTNNVKSTRSTVGTMTEINDYLKLLMPRIAKAFCPSCEREIRPETGRGIVEHSLTAIKDKTALVTFAVPVPAESDPADFFSFLQQQGFLRVWIGDEIHRTDEKPALKRLPAQVHVVQDRITVSEKNRSRLTEAVEAALRFGKGVMAFIGEDGTLHPFSTGWHCAHCDLEITPPTPGLFSFNHPLGACPACRGFGRTMGIDLDRALPDKSLSIFGGVVKPFQTENGKQCQHDLVKAAREREIPLHAAFEELSKADQDFIVYGDRKNSDVPSEDLWESDRWYGVKGFFDWLETKVYKMHVRVLLSRYRSYTKCPECRGGRYQPETLNFKIAVSEKNLTLPDLALMPVGELAALMESLKPDFKRDPAASLLLNEVATRLSYLVEVGVGYLNLDRPTRTLSGGEVERVNLTSCLGASLVNTLFVMDEPTVGLHPRDVGKLIRVMKNLRDKGNTLLVVEHEESVIRAADNLIELGPGRGELGGELMFNGPIDKVLESKNSLTANYLTGRMGIPVPKKRRVAKHWLKVQGANEHNLQNLDVKIPLGVFLCITGVSGSGKSTLVHDVLYQNLRRLTGDQLDEDLIGKCKRVIGADRIGDIVMVDQSPLAKTPKSTPAVYLGAFDHIRHLFGSLPEAREQGLTPGSFSFNAGTGRCERCGGNGFEKIEMQFLSDVFVRCPECDGKRYRPNILKIKLREKTIHDILEMTVSEAIHFFAELKSQPILRPLKVLEEVGLGYLRLGQPLNVLSGGESQRLKLVSHLVHHTKKDSLLIFDEPTTGLHFDDVAQLLKVFQRLVAEGNSLLVIEHNLEVIKSADYLIDLGPEAGTDGGLIVAEGTPEEVAKCEASHTGRYLRSLMASGSRQSANYADIEAEENLRVAEEPEALARSRKASLTSISITGAREHNLKNISLEIPREKMVVVTGLSGSGKSTLAFDILFAEGQRRFLDSMSPYARQFVQQLEKPDVDLLTGLPPTVAIEQRLTRGGGKSTVATVTEIYHFLRLLFAKLGTQFCPKCQLPVENRSTVSIVRLAEELAKKGPLKILAPLVKARKGFHTDVAERAGKQGYETLFVDGEFVAVDGFQKLERFKEHSIDVVLGEISADSNDVEALVKRALKIGKGAARLLDAKNHSTILSSEMNCPGCGEAFEELDPRLFSFNSPHGWCTGCRGFGEVWDAAEIDKGDSVLEAELHEERQHEKLEAEEAVTCPMCKGSRLNVVARNVRLQNFTMDNFVMRPVRGVIALLEKLNFDKTQRAVADDVIAEIRQRLEFMGKVGLDYLALNRSAKTLSGGESQRIRLAAQLGTNLRGVLYVLDEPTIGLHARDNEMLLETLEALKSKGNSLVIVEHDEETMQRADVIIDLGPGAGILGGEVVAIGTLDEIKKNKNSATGRCLSNPTQHPRSGERRSLKDVEGWIAISGAAAHNLKGIDVKIPVGRFTVLSGVSGSGKSTLMRSVLAPAVTSALAKNRHHKKNKRIALDSISGTEFLSAVYEVDQSPIGKTSRSTPATYIKVFDEIRKLYATLPLARMRGYTASRFSFNNQGGRCESCQGQGVIKIEMSFLPPSYIPCSDCHGARYNAQTLEVLYNERSIGDVMEMTISQAAEFFRTHSKIRRSLSLLADTGLGYLKLGQPSPTLSGGEAQRLKLVTELTRGVARQENDKIRRQRKSKSILYLLEEPTIGLHMADVERLLDVLHRLVDAGNTVIVIEHNLPLIAEADYVIDIGPEAGDAGGEVVASGTPEDVAKNQKSHTARFLRALLKENPLEKVKPQKTKKSAETKTEQAKAAKPLTTKKPKSEKPTKAKTAKKTPPTKNQKSKDRG